MKLCAIFAVFFGLFVPFTEEAKVLFITPSLSNSVVIQAGRLADLLVLDGHDVTFFIPSMVSSNRVNGTKHAKILRMDGFRDYFVEGLQVYLADTYLNRISPTYKKWVMADAQIYFWRDLLIRKKEWDHLRDEKFDLIFTNSLDYCDVGLAHYIGSKAHIWLVTGPLHEANNYVLGIPHPVSYLPTLEDNLRGPGMSFHEKMTNMFLWIESTFVHKYYKYRAQQLYNGLTNGNFPDLHQLASQSALVFANDLDFLNFAGPTLTKVKNIGGAGIPRVKPLEADFETMFKKGSKGVVLISFGTAFDTAFMPPAMRKGFVQTIKQFSDYHFVFKIGANDTLTRSMASGLNNVDLVTWMPQTDILAHPRLKGFMTHGGMNSVVEGAMNGVPLIVLPLFFDQFRNAKLVEHRNFGVFIEQKRLDQQTLTYALNQILNYPKYKTGAMRMKTLFQENPNQPDETFLKWTNFVIRNGPLPELVPKGVELDLLQYFCIDVVVFIIVVPILIAFVLYKILFGLYGLKK